MPLRGRILMLLAGCAIAAAASATVSAAPRRPVPSLDSNRQAARSDARRHLAALTLPPGATPSTTEPAGDHRYLKPMLALMVTEARADVHGWWTLSGSPESVLAYVEAHPPAGSKVFATGSGGNSLTGSREQSVDFSWPPVRGVLGFRELAITVTSLPGGATGVLAQAESEWIVPRPASERVPARTRAIAITSASLGGPATQSVTVTRPGQVRQIVAWIDALPIVQPATYFCPAQPVTGARVITLDFLTAAEGRLLARATYNPSFGGASGPCNPIDFTIGGRRQHPLIGGNFVGRVQRLLGVRLTTAG